MERNTYGISPMESEVLLPPRKRLLAGFKKLNADANGSGCSPPKPMSSSTSSASSDLNSPNLTPEEVAEASRSAAAATRAAKAARTAADEKAVAAAEAVAAAKRALDLVAAFSDEEAAAREICLKKNQKLKKHAPIKILYTEEGQRENYRADVELAHRLHRAINSSSRILGLCSDSPPKRLKRNKNHKGLDTSGNSRLSIEHEIGMEGSSASFQADEREPLQLEYITRDNMSSHRRNTKRVKVKMLLLSNCSSRDEEEGIAIPKSSQLPTVDINKKPQYSPAGLRKVGPARTWICQGFKATESVKQAVGS